MEAWIKIYSGALISTHAQRALSLSSFLFFFWFRRFSGEIRWIPEEYRK